MSLGFMAPVTEARRILKRHDIKEAPIDVVGLCEKEGVKIIYVDLDEVERLTGKAVAGAIQKRPEQGCMMFINEKDISTRARFTIAHELGHHFLHMADSDDKIITSFRMDKSPIETQANRFAAELLMPEDLVRAEYSRMVIPVSDTLAKIFDVSKQAMRIRLDELELIYV